MEKLSYILMSEAGIEFATGNITRLEGMEGVLSLGMMLVVPKLRQLKQQGT